MGLPMTPTEKRGNCAACGRFYQRISRRARFCSPACAWSRNGAPRKPESWYLRQDGYIAGYLWRDGRRVATPHHRLALEQHLGRKLRADEVVHHRNGDRADNRLENLAVMTRAEHAAHHSTGRKHTPESIETMRRIAKERGAVKRFRAGRA